MPTTEQIREQKLAKIILAQALEDADVLGEALMKYAFVGRGRGCYSNFELRSSFRLWEAGKDKFADDLCGFWPKELEDQEYRDEKARISSYLDPELDLVVVWLWDGDGHLIFKLGDVALENTDIKKSYGWRFINAN